MSDNVDSLEEKSVFITRTIPEAGIAVLATAGVSVRLNPLARGLTPDELIEEVGRYDGVICQLSDRINADVLKAAAPRCKVFANCAVGFDNFDLARAEQYGIALTNTPDVLTEATADLTWALMLATARRIGEAERVVRAGAWRGWGMLDFLGADIFGQTLGIVGAGRIGTAVAHRASGFSMRVLYYDRDRSPIAERAGAKRVGLTELLEASDIVSLHMPLTEDTRDLIGENALGRMKRNAILINTARGEIVDQAALIRALERGRLAGAGFDVYRNEPIIPPELSALENVVLLPHIGSATVNTRTVMSEVAANNVIAVLRGEEALNPIGV